MNCSHCGATNIGEVAVCPFCKTPRAAVRQDEMNDVSLAAVGAGCLTSFVGTLFLGVLVFVVALLFQAFGARQALLNAVPLLSFLSFVLGCALDIAAGFVTARRASHAKNLHALIVGVLLILVSLACFVLLPQNANTSALLATLRCFCILPLVLYGAFLEELNR